MTTCVEKLQWPEFAARDRRYTFVSQQQEVGTDIPEAEKLTDRACRVEFALAEHGL